MPSILLLSGSPSAHSRSAALLEHARRHFTAVGLNARLLGLADFPAGDLLFARYDSPAFDSLKRLLAEADALVVATPVYKASFAGGLKTILDVLPPAALRGKTVLPLATGGSPAHQLVIDYALKPVLAALGATDLRQGVYFVDQQLTIADGGRLEFADDGLRARFDDAVAQLTSLVATSATSA